MGPQNSLGLEGSGASGDAEFTLAAGGDAKELLANYPPDLEGANFPTRPNPKFDHVYDERVWNAPAEVDLRDPETSDQS